MKDFRPAQIRLEDPEYRAEYERCLDDLLDTHFHPRVQDEIVIYFYGGPFSNFARSPFIATDQWGRDNRYPTVEHYFQAWKAGTIHNHDYVLRATSAKEAKKRGGVIALRSDWESIKYGVMLTALRHKFELEPFRSKLLATGVAMLREDSPTDYIWGWRNNGLNLLGRALSHVRREIRQQIAEGETSAEG